MIVLRTSRELAVMRVAGRISANVSKLAGQAVEPGVSTWEIDRIVRRYIESEDAKPSFLGYGGFPANARVSVNNVVIRGIPSKDLILGHGGIVSIDIGAFYEGFIGDSAYTFACGDVSSEAQRLMDTTRESLYEGIRAAKAGSRVGDIGRAMQTYVEARGHSVVRDSVGHGVGAKLHKNPSVPNFGAPGRGVRLLPGMAIAIEPMANAGMHTVKTLSDGWTTVTTDGKLVAHYEHPIAVTTDGPVILTLPD